MSLDVDLTEGRYDRQQLLTWWDQPRLAAANVLVVGGGALGNEQLKNLALLGVGHLTVVDFDVVSRSNLARCVLFRETDEGAPKAQVVAAAAAALNPNVTVSGLNADVRTLGLGMLSGFDVVLGGLDNREARLWVNAACRKLGIPWIDGAIEGLRGVVRTFLPDGACYECTLGEADRAILARRQSCALLSTADMLEGKVPTTATTSSVIAAVQVQEAVKMLTGRSDLLALRGQGMFFVGDTLESYVVDFGQDEFCLAHDRYGPLRPTPATPDLTLFGLLEQLPAAVVDDLGGLDAVDLEFDLILSAICPACAQVRLLRRRAAGLRPGDGQCSSCGAVCRLDSRASLSPEADVELMHRSLADLDLGDRDVVTLRGPAGRVHLDLLMSR
jgi:molybdopterin/thiamine biosynthesis adenylyltransferase